MRVRVLKAIFDFLSNRFGFVVSLAPVDDVSCGVPEFDSPAALLMEHDGNTILQLQNATQVLSSAILVGFRPTLFQTVFDEDRSSPFDGRHLYGLVVISLIWTSLSESSQQIGTGAENNFANNQ